MSRVGSNVLSGQREVFRPPSLGRGGARKRRRVILLRSVGWLPPDVPPSGASLALGPRSLSKPLNAAEGDPTPGRRRFGCTSATFCVAGTGALGPCT